MVHLTRDPHSGPRVTLETPQNHVGIALPVAISGPALLSLKLDPSPKSEIARSWHFSMTC